MNGIRCEAVFYDFPEIRYVPKNTGEQILPYHLLLLYAISGRISITEYLLFWFPIIELKWPVENGIRTFPKIQEEFVF